MNHATPPTIDPVAAQRWLATVPAQSPWLHEEVGRRMQERLDWIKQQPSTWANWFALHGGQQTHALLAKRFAGAPCYLVEASAAQQRQLQASLGSPWWSPARWKAAPVHFDMPPEGGVQMLWANMALHMAVDPQALIAQWHRSLAPEGYVMFSCLGPDTAQELRAVYAGQGWPVPGYVFTDMHDWGDMLVQAGFDEPVMDMERIVLTFETPQRLLEELRGLGRNLHPARFAGLRGRGWHQQLLQLLLAQGMQDGRLPLTFEIIYGHAFKPQPRVRVDARSTVSLQDMRAMLRAGKS